MAILATSQMSIIDLSDLPTLGLYLTSTNPSVVTYDPDTETYIPDWSVNTLTLTPVIRLDGEVVSIPNSNINVTWSRKYDASAETSVESGSNGETVSNGVLRVANNKFTTYSTVTYVCTVTYTDPDSSEQVSTQSQMTYSVIKNAPTVKSCSIVGNNMFLYDGEGNIRGESTITLTANLQNVEVNCWQYYNSSQSAWVNYTMATGGCVGNTLTVKASDGVFYNDVARIKLLTSDASVYDLMSVVKIRDGAAGGNSIVVQLSNDSHTLPADGNGNVLSYNGANTVVTVYEGGEDVSSQWNIGATAGSGVTGRTSTDNSGHLTYTVTGLTDDASYVEITATFPKTGAAQTRVTKRFSLTKNRSGNDAVIYELRTPTKVVNKDKNDNFSPASVSFTGHRTVGIGSAEPYQGIYKFYLSTDGEEYTLVKTAGTVNSLVTGYSYPGSGDTQFINNSTRYKSLKCEMYDNKGTTLLDTETVYIVNDGVDGEKGAAGESAFNIVLGNYADTIPCLSNGNTSSAKTINIPFKAYVGTTNVACTCSITNLPTGISATTNRAATTSADGLVVLTVANNSTLGGAKSGEITLTFTATHNNKSYTSAQVFSWSKTIQGTNGINAKNFYIQPRNGVYVFENGTGQVILDGYMLDGATDVSTGGSVAYNWYKMSGGSWGSSLGTGRSYTVNPADVVSCACYKCVASYGGKDYVAYTTVQDNTDPYFCTIYSSLGTQIVNNSGNGAVYCRVFRGREEVDGLKSDVFLTAHPSSPSTGTHYYHIDASNKSVSLKRYNGSAWVAGTEGYKYTYNWYARNKDGKFINHAGTVVTTSTPYATGKVFYIDGSMIDKKITFDVEVLES